MKYIDLSLNTPQENLALDEALLDSCEEGGSGEILRLWEPESYFVVLGYSNKINSEVNLAYCRGEKIPVLRRVSGGGTVLQGPGCLNYAVILDMQKDKRLQSITRANQLIMERNKDALQPLLPEKELQIRGDTDLTWQFFKFSGNAQRRKKRFLLFHGTFLIDFDLKMIKKTLLPPTRQPEYRKNRPHMDFVRNLPVAKDKVREALKKGWEAFTLEPDLPTEKMSRLAAEKYSQEEFIRKF